MTDFQTIKHQLFGRWFADGRAVRCHYCGVLLCRATVTVDHKLPRHRGRRAQDPDNFVPACQVCNGLKGFGAYEAFKAYKLPEKQARLAGQPLPDLGPSPMTLPNGSRLNGLKMLPGRVRLLRLLSADGAYALPAGTIPHRFLDGRMARFDEAVALAYEARGWVERARPPKECKGYAFVWKITPAGLAALAEIDRRAGD